MSGTSGNLCLRKNITLNRPLDMCKKCPPVFKNDCLVVAKSNLIKNNNYPQAKIGKDNKQHASYENIETEAKTNSKECVICGGITKYKKFGLCRRHYQNWCYYKNKKENKKFPDKDLFKKFLIFQKSKLKKSPIKEEEMICSLCAKKRSQDTKPNQKRWYSGYKLCPACTQSWNKFKKRHLKKFDHENKCLEAYKRKRKHFLKYGKKAKLEKRKVDGQNDIKLKTAEEKSILTEVKKINKKEIRAEIIAGLKEAMGVDVTLDCEICLGIGDKKETVSEMKWTFIAWFSEDVGIKLGKMKIVREYDK